MNQPATKFVIAKGLTSGLAVFALSDADHTAFAGLDLDKLPEPVEVFLVENSTDLLDGRITTKDLLGVYNAIVETKLAKFQDKTSAADRTFPVLVQGAQPYAMFVAAVSPKPVEQPKPAATPKPAGEKKTRKGAGFNDREAKSKIHPCRARTKQAQLVDALTNGATMAQLLAACGSDGKSKAWTESSVKSALYWDINSQKGYGVKAVANDKGELVYSLTFPKGMTGPLPHTPSKTKKA